MIRVPAFEACERLAHQIGVREARQCEQGRIDGEDPRLGIPGPDHQGGQRQSRQKSVLGKRGHAGVAAESRAAGALEA